jgi:hypothetical protein
VMNPLASSLLARSLPWPNPASYFIGSILRVYRAALNAERSSLTSPFVYAVISVP